MTGQRLEIGGLGPLIGRPVGGPTVGPTAGLKNHGWIPRLGIHGLGIRGLGNRGLGNRGRKILGLCSLLDAHPIAYVLLAHAVAHRLSVGLLLAIVMS